MINETVSHYRILEKLGQGGMGIVYKARDTKLDRTVALKFLAKDLSCNEEAKARFIQEAKAASALNHPNITTIYEMGEADGECFIAMECIEGRSLKELIQKGETRNWDRDKVIDVTTQVTEGLSKAHQRGIVHRDIKSANIMLTDDGLAKIMDFGVAKLKGAAELTQDGGQPGTVAYMSPEQASGKAVDRRTDIWSLGVVLYEMLAGRMPFEGEHDQAVIYSILNEEPQPISTLTKGVPSGLDVVVRKSLMKEPAARYQDASEMLADLEAVRKGETLPGEVQVREGKRWLGRLTVPAVGALLLLAAAIVLFRPGREARIPPVVSRIPVGVMFFDNQTNEDKYDYLRKALADMLITDLGQSRYLQVLTFPRMFELLKSMGYEEAEVIDASLGCKLCQTAGASVMIMGSLSKSGETFVINTQVLDVDTKRQIAAHRVTGEGETSILGHLVDDLTDRIKKDMEISAREIRREQKDITALTTTSLDAYKYYLTGKEAAFRMSNQEAIESFEQAVATDSGFIEAHDALARQYYTIGDRSEAVRVCERLKTIATDSDQVTPERLLEVLALEAMLKEDWDMAVTYLRKITSADPENIRAHVDLGMVFYQRKKMYDLGIAEFKKVLELDPKGMTHRVDFTYGVLGYAYLRKGEHEKAGAAFNRYVDLSPKKAYPMNCLGEYCLIVGDYDRALTVLKQALEIEPDSPLAHASLGDTYLAKGMYAEAGRSYQRYLTLCPGQSRKADAHFLLGKLNYLKGDYVGAVRECQQASELDVTMPEAHWILGLSLIKQGMAGQAEAETLAISKLTEADGVDESRAYYHHLVGEFCLSQGLQRQAFHNLRNAANMTSLGRTFFLNALGQAYLNVGEYGAALGEFEAALDANPNCAQTHYLLGLLYDQQGAKDKAKEHFGRLVEVWKDADESMPQLIDAKKRLELL